jgi:hypothetical protein
VLNTGNTTHGKASWGVDYVVDCIVKGELCSDEVHAAANCYHGKCGIKNYTQSEFHYDFHVNTFPVFAASSTGSYSILCAMKLLEELGTK